MMNRCKKYMLLLLLAVLPFMVQAQDDYTLQRCLEIALANNYSLKISRNTTDIAKNNVSLANAGFLPTLSADASYSGTVNNTKSEAADGTKTSANGVHNQNYGAGVDLNWNLFSGFKVTTTYERLKEIRTIGELSTQIAIENTIAQIAGEYYNFIRQHRRYKNFEYVLSLSRERLRITQTQYQLGARSKLEVLQARVDFNADSSNLVNQHQTILASETRLKTLMGGIQSFDQKLTIADTSINVNSSLDYAQLQDQMLQSNTSLLTAARNTRISELDLKLVKSRSLPYLQLSSGYGYTQNRYGNSSVKMNENTGLNYGLTLGINILDGFNYHRNVTNARLNIDNMALQYRDLEQQVKANLYIIYSSYQNNLQLLSMERQNFSVAKENFEIAMERYKLGALAGIELREAQKSFQDAEERLLLIEYQIKADEILLLQVAGRITEYL